MFLMIGIFKSLETPIYRVWVFSRGFEPRPLPPEGGILSNYASGAGLLKG